MPEGAILLIGFERVVVGRLTWTRMAERSRFAGLRGEVCVAGGG